MTVSYAVDTLAADDATIDAINTLSYLYCRWRNSQPAVLAIYTQDK
jgi:hypothetical protein